jgi:cytochrome o ubiquinol oxidase subunit 2
MHKRYKYALVVVVALAAMALVAFFLLSVNAAVLTPKGVIAEKERDLIVFASLLSLTVVVPVFTLAFGIAWRYRAGNLKARYMPDWDHSRVIETIWWLVPLTLITILSVVTWNSSHELDPFRPLASNVKPMKIQVVALQWKWLFIYPEKNIASVNFVQFPKNTPIDFEITSDAPMNSFWIPQLGGQIYAMSGMATHLHLMASEAGSYNGSSANISGSGFAGMSFVAKASTNEEFSNWVTAVTSQTRILNLKEYANLAKPSKNDPPSSYSFADADLYNQIIMKYMAPNHMGM